ncbi:hypothetical protein pb186bvf_007581, partial [Paramecium bursaria]
PHPQESEVDIVKVQKKEQNYFKIKSTLLLANMNLQLASRSFQVSKLHNISGYGRKFGFFIQKSISYTLGSQNFNLLSTY